MDFVYGEKHLIAYRIKQQQRWRRRQQMKKEDDEDDKKSANVDDIDCIG